MVIEHWVMKVVKPSGKVHLLLKSKQLKIKNSHSLGTVQVFVQNRSRVCMLKVSGCTVSKISTIFYP